MKVKAFSFTAHTYDPRLLDLSVTTFVYRKQSNGLERVQLEEREFIDDDVLDFDAEFGDTFNISYNDIIHGDHTLRVYEAEIPDILLMKIYSYNDRIETKQSILFRIIDEHRRTVYVDNIYFSSPLKMRIARVARLLGIPQPVIEEEIKRIKQSDM